MVQAEAEPMHWFVGQCWWCGWCPGLALGLGPGRCPEKLISFDWTSWQTGGPRHCLLGSHKALGWLVCLPLWPRFAPVRSTLPLSGDRHHLGPCLSVPSTSEASASLEGGVMPCPHDAVTSFPRVFLCGDCSPNQDGDSAHYKLVRQRLCAPSRDRLSGSLASLPLPRTPGQWPLHGASLLGLSAPSPGTQTDRHCFLRPLCSFYYCKNSAMTIQWSPSLRTTSEQSWTAEHLEPEVIFTVDHISWGKLPRQPGV